LFLQPDVARTLKNAVYYGWWPLSGVIMAIIYSTPT